MKKAKKLIAVVLSVAILASTLVFGLTTSAATDPDAMIITSTNSYSPNSFIEGDEPITIVADDGSLALNYMEPGSQVSGNFKADYKSWSEKGTLTIANAAPLDNSISSQYALKLSATENEGYGVSKHPIFFDNSVWCSIGSAKYVLIHVKVPAGKTTTSGIRTSFGISGMENRYTLFPDSVTPDYWYLSKDSSVWTYGGAASNFGYGAVESTLPSGFEGYIAFAIPEDVTAVGNVSIESIEIRLGTVGPDYGDFYYGGVYTTADKISAGAYATKALCRDNTVAMCDGESKITFSFNSWVEADKKVTESYSEYVDNHNGYASGNAIKVSVDGKDEGNNSGDTTSGLKDAVIPVYRSLKNVTHIMMYIEVPENADLRSGYNIRFYPDSAGGFRVTDASGTTYRSGFANKELSYIGIDDSEWRTTAADVNSQISADAIGGGFKGYIKVAVSDLTFGTLTDYSGLTLTTVGMGLGKYGDTYGDFYFGGVYMISTDADSHYAKLGADGEVESITFGRDMMYAYSGMNSPLMQDSEPTIETENLKTTTSHASVPVAMTSASAASTGNDYRITIGQGWISNSAELKSKATMSYTETKAAGYKRALRISSEQAEGKWNTHGTGHFWLCDTSYLVPYENQSAAYLTNDFYANYIMIYVEMPETSGSDENAMRFMLVTQDYGSNLSMSGCDYYMLDNTSSEWVKGDAALDADGQFSIPNGFAGYILFDTKAKVEALVAADTTNGTVEGHVKFNRLLLSVGTFGGEYGDFIYGGCYAVKDFNQAINLTTYNTRFDVSWKKDIYGPEYMTSNKKSEIYYHGDVNKSFNVDICDLVALNNAAADADYYYVDADMVLDGKIQDNDMAVLRKCLIGAINIDDLKSADLADVINFEDAVSAISEANVATAYQIDSATAAYMALSDEQQTFVSTDKVAKLNTLNAALTSARPTMLGFSCKDNGAIAQALKIGTDCNVTVPQGYTVTGYGTVAISAANFDASAPLTVDTKGATVTSVAATDANGQISAVYSFADKTKYLDDILTRSYVEYSDGENTYKVYNNIYKYSDDVEDLCMSARLVDVANHFNVAIFQKLAAAISDILSA